MNIKIASQFKTLSLALAILVSGAPSLAFASTGPVYPWPGGDQVQLTPAEAANQNRPQANPFSVSSRPEQASTGEPDPIMNMLNQLLSSRMTGSGFAGPGFVGDMGDFGGIQTGDERFPGMSQIPGSGKMEPCGGMNGPTQVKAALMEAKEFMNRCALARRGPNQKIAINDYSGAGTPHMYIFDLEGNCLGKTAVSYGNGAGKVKPQPCSDEGRHLTPAGFHLTSYHDGAKYDAARAIGMVGLQGQNSVARGVIIHPAKSPGTASSWGCSGVGFDAFNAVKTTLGHGSLVYNFFGDANGPANCQNNPGKTGQHGGDCRMDAGGNPVPSSSTAGGSPALTESAR